MVTAEIARRHSSGERSDSQRSSLVLTAASMAQTRPGPAAAAGQAAPPLRRATVTAALQTSVIRRDSGQRTGGVDARPSADSLLAGVLRPPLGMA